MRRRVTNWWLLQRLSWKALVTHPEVMRRALVGAAVDEKGSADVSDEDLMRQAFRDKMAGKTNEQSAAMQTLQRRHGI